MPTQPEFLPAILSTQMAKNTGDGLVEELAAESGHCGPDVYRHPEVFPASWRRNRSFRLILVGASTCALVILIAGCSSPGQSDVTVSPRSAKALLLTGSEIGHGWSILQPVSTANLKQIPNEANCRLGPDVSPVGGVIASVSFISNGALSEVDESLISPTTASGAYSRLLNYVHHCGRTVDEAPSRGSQKPVSFPLRAVASPGVGIKSVGFDAELGSKDNPNFYFKYYVEVGKVIVELTTLGRDVGASFAHRIVKLAVNKVTA